jgi:hypothetical protein
MTVDVCQLRAKSREGERESKRGHIKGGGGEAGDEGNRQERDMKEKEKGNQKIINSLISRPRQAAPYVREQHLSQQ